MELRYIILFVSAFFIVCDAQSSTGASNEASSPPAASLQSSLPTDASKASTKSEIAKEVNPPSIKPDEDQEEDTPVEDNEDDKDEAKPSPTQPPMMATAKEEEMQKDAPAPEATTTMEAKTEKPEEKATTEGLATTTKATTMVEPTRMHVKGSSTEPPLVHSIATEIPKQEVKNNTTKKPETGGEAGQNASSPIHSSLTLIILGLIGLGFARYQSY